MLGAVLVAALLSSGGTAAEGQVAEGLVVLDVPFLAQTEALCGGAAAAMVMRYWGARVTRPEAFADLVDSDRGGITTGDLVERLRSLGFQALPFRGHATLVRHHLQRSRPVIGLIEPSPGSFHYVVFVAWSGSRILLHDPALGPFRVEEEATLQRQWAASDHWALLVLPGEPPVEASTSPETGASGATPLHEDSSTASSPSPDGCDRLVDEAVDRARRNLLEDAERRLGAAVALCPERGRPWRELAAVRFRQERWHEAAVFAERATRQSPQDGHAWRLLATSRFLDDDLEGALRAWNRVGEPVVDDVAVTGMERTRHDVVLAWLGVDRGAPLAPPDLLRARRRLAELPAASLTRLSYRPLGEGRARVEAAVVERPLVDRPWRLLTRAAADAVTDRQTRLRLDSPARRGGSLEVAVRWWTKRPAVRVAAIAPRALGLPGLLGVEGTWDEQPYAVAASAEPLVETLRRGSVTQADWLSPSLRLGLELAGERWSGRGSFLSLGGRLEQRFLLDRGALVLAGRRAVSLSDGPGFAAGGVTLALRSSSSARCVTARGRLGLYGASAKAPLGRWPGAGLGHARELLLRAHPLLEDGVINGPAFGRRLLHASVEVEVNLVTFGPMRLGLAGFLDWARARERLPSLEGDADLVDVGGGLRLGLPGSLPALRLDAATGLKDGGLTLSAGWQLAWPR
jgi:hypothetical protein